MELLARGSSDAVIIDTKKALHTAVLKKASSVSLSHNHPSNDPRPSSEDVVLTNRLCTVFNAAGITFVDHVIVCPNGETFSFHMQNMI